MSWNLLVSVLCIIAVSLGFGQTCIGGYWDITSNVWFGDCTYWDSYDGSYYDGPLPHAYSVTVSGDTTFTLADNSSQTIYWKLFWFDNIVDTSLPVPDSVPLLAGVHCWELDGSSLAYLLNSGNTYLDGEPGAMRVISLTFSVNQSCANSGTWWWGRSVSGVPTPWAENVIVALIKDRIKDGAQLLANAGASNLTGKYVDENRVYLRGHSMGGTGTYRIGIKHPEIFSAIHAHAGFADFKGPCGAFGGEFDDMVGTAGQQCRGIDGNMYVARDYTDMSWFIRDHKGVSWENMMGQNYTYEPPYVCMTHGTNDNAVNIASADRIYHVLDSLKYGCSFWRHNGEHSDGCGTRSQWMLNIRKNQSYLAFTNNTTNTADHLNYLDQIGWVPSSIVDSVNRYEVQLTGSTGTVSVTPRRLQRFVVTPFKTFHYWIGTQSGNGTAVTADGNGTLTLTNISAGSKLIIEPDVFSKGEGRDFGLQDGLKIMTTPNPFNPSIVISIIGQKQKGDLAVYDIQGKLVQALVFDGQLPATGIAWDASKMHSGMYVVRARYGQNTVSKAITLMK